MSDELAIKAVQQVIRSVEDLNRAWDGETLDATLRSLLENIYRDIEEALQYMPGYPGTTEEG